MIRFARLSKLIFTACALCFFSGIASANANRPDLKIPRIPSPPHLESFLNMEPDGEVEKSLVKVEGFIQNTPRDGDPASQRTEAYLGYDNENIYVVAVCFDSEPDKVRARMARRENAFGDDFVEVTFDTFQDERRGYVFWTNPLGIQAEAVWIEGAGEPDFSFNTLWYSEGKRTDKGYVVLMKVPFKSLRFPSTSIQNWGLVLLRHIPRSNEWAYWPRVSSRIEGRLNQAARMNGIENISPGRNIQLIPYGSFRSFRALDQRDPANPQFINRRAEVDGGLDAKFVVKDSFVIDVAVNPDFSQVESDEPQIVAAERFEVFFPERRPFFLENANYFQTPINLVFTRRIADPQLGIRVTGKAGPYALGAMFMDDQSPGRSVADTDPLADKRATFGIVRASRDILKQSTIGAIYTDREFQDSHNRVGGIDGRFKLNNNWVSSFQAAYSSTRLLDGSNLSGPAYNAGLTYDSRKLFYTFQYTDRSPDFITLTGFVPRTDIRQAEQRLNYRFRPEGKTLISWGPSFYARQAWDYEGTRLDYESSLGLNVELTGQTNFGLFHFPERERLRPKDFSILEENKDFSRRLTGFSFGTSWIPQISVEGVFFRGHKVNFNPAAGKEPDLVNRDQGNLGVTLRPMTQLRIDNTYILLRLRDRATGANIINNHIVRSNINWQFSRELSLRTILQYDALLTNRALTSLETTKNFNADFLAIYQVNPWTVLFVGYNSNLQNIDLVPEGAGSRIIRPRDRLINDGRQFFVKFSYLFRF